MKEPRVRVKKESQNPKATSAPCGTYAGWNAHKKRGETPCNDCRIAVNEYTALRRFRTGYTRSPSRCDSCGSVFRDHECMGPQR